ALARQPWRVTAPRHVRTRAGGGAERNGAGGAGRGGGPHRRPGVCVHRPRRRPLRAAPGVDRRPGRRAGANPQGRGPGRHGGGERLVPDRLREPLEGGDLGHGRPEMIARIIEYCATHRARVFVCTAFVVVGSLIAIRRVPLDAIPDLSDPQVIIFTEWMGRSPDLVEDQVTYPIVSSLVAAP